MNTGTSAELWAGKGRRKAVSLIHAVKYHIATNSCKINTSEPSQRFTYFIVSAHGGNSVCLNTNM